MKNEYDFSRAKRGALDPVSPGKTRITIRLDDDVLDWFRDQADSTGGGNYQTMINATLREYITGITGSVEPLEDTLRRVVREELAAALERPPHRGGSPASSPSRRGRRPSASQDWFRRFFVRGISTPASSRLSRPW